MKIPSSTFALGGEPTNGQLVPPSDEEFRELKERWAQLSDEEVTEEIRRHLKKTRDRSMAIRLVVERYQQLRDARKPPKMDEFCERFRSAGSRIYSSMFRELELVDYFNAHPEVLMEDLAFPWPEPGDEVAGFIVEEELGEGGIGHVYLCRQPEMGNRQVVVKMSRHKTPEASTLGKLTHDNITPVHAVFTDEQEGLNCLVMPFLGRSTLDELLDEAFHFKRPETGKVICEAAKTWNKPHELPAPDHPRLVEIQLQDYVECILDIGIQLSDALAFAHRHKVIHGDVKPSNVLLTPLCQPILLDFNLSHNDDLELELRGGTLPYMSPEQIDTLTSEQTDQPRYDHRTDVYALGALLYQLLTGVVPFHSGHHGFLGKEGARGLIEDRKVPAPPVHRRNTAVPKELGELIAKALAYRPEDRYSTMTEFRDAIAQERRRMLAARAAEALRRQREKRRRFLLTVIFCALAIGVVLFRLRPPTDERLTRQGIAKAKQLPQEALTLFSQAREINPTNVMALYGFMQISARQGRVAEAYGAGYGTSYIYDYPTVCAFTGWCGTDLRRYEGAAECYERAIEIGLNTAGVHNNLGHALLEFYRERVAGRAPNAKLTLRTPEEKREILQRAIRHLEQAITLNEQLFQPRVNLVFATLELHALDEATPLESLLTHCQWLVKNAHQQSWSGDALFRLYMATDSEALQVRLLDLVPRTEDLRMRLRVSAQMRNQHLIPTKGTPNSPLWEATRYLLSGEGDPLYLDPRSDSRVSIVEHFDGRAESAG